MLNLGDGGIQLMTSPMEPLEDGRYEVVLLLGKADVEPNDDEQMYFSNAIVERAWCAPGADGHPCAACASSPLRLVGRSSCVSTSGQLG